MTAVVAASLVACAVPYRPTVAKASASPPDAFERVLQVVQSRYPRLLRVDRAGFRIQSAWTTVATPPPAQRRASVFRQRDGEIAVVVERRVLDVAWFGGGGWSSPRSDRREEERLAEAIEGVLGSP